MRVFTWDEFLRKDGKEGALWTCIHGGVYDVTTFKATHPGGDQIIGGGSKDATALFESMHPNSAVRDLLPKYKIGEIDVATIPKNQEQFTFDSPFHVEVKRRVFSYFKRRNLSRQDHWLQYVKLVVTMTGFLLSWYSVMMCGMWYLIPIWGFFNAMVGIQVMHDANHGAFSRNLMLNRILGWSIDLIGGSSLVWRSEHNLGHHIHTNHDNDPDTTSGWPLIRFNPTTGHKWWHQYQHIYVWFMYAVVAGRWYFNDFSLITKLPQEQRIDAPVYEWKAFWFFKVAFPLWHIALPAYYVGVSQAVGLYLLNSVVSSYWFALQFAPTHISTDAEFPQDPMSLAQTRDWATLQVHSSTNYSTEGWLATLVSGGLNYQIEHHLFPSISHSHYPALAPIVRDCCREFGVPYTSHDSWFSGVYAHFLHLYRMGRAPGSRESTGRFPQRHLSAQTLKKAA